MTRFSVVSTQRTGSTMLITMLNSHPDVLCAGEIFFPRSGSDHAFRKFVQTSTGKRLRHQLSRASLVSEFLEQFYEKSAFQAVGFKYMYSQSRHIPRLYPSVLSYLRKHNLPVIHNVRENPLRVLVSRTAAKSSGVYRSRDTRREEGLTLPVKGLLPQLEKLQQEDHNWSRQLAGLPYLRVSYEALLADSQQQQKRLLAFLGVAYRGELTCPFNRLHPANLESLLVNYGEIERTLTGSDFEWCLGRSDHASLH